MVNIILAVFQFLLVVALGAVLAIYSRFGGEYANSVRWTSQGGYIEMISSLYNSSHILPTRVKLIMIATVFATLAASILDKGAARFISPSQRSTNATSTLIVAEQLALHAGGDPSFGGWTTYVAAGHSIVDAMEQMINSTRIIAAPVDGRSYLPGRTPYSIRCANSTIVALSGATPRISLATGGCSELQFQLAYTTNLENPLKDGSIVIDYTKVVKVKRCPTRWSLKIPRNATSANIDIVSQQILVSLMAGSDDYIPYDNIEACAQFSSKWYAPMKHMGGTNGLLTLPTTVTTKCTSTNVNTIVTSITSVPFIVSYAATSPTIQHSASNFVLLPVLFSQSTILFFKLWRHWSTILSLATT